MQVSVVLPNLNGGQWLENCLKSLFAQTVQNFEIIVVDNASGDESINTARHYAGQKKIILVENPQNTGFSAAVNVGIGLAKAPYVLLFNNDAFAQPDMIKNLLLAMEKDSRIFAAQCLMLRHNSPGKVDTMGDFVSVFGWAFQSGHNCPAKSGLAQRRVFSACGGAAMYRKAVFKEIGLFEEAFFAYLEDVDIGWRANSQGYKNVLCPTAVCTHIGGAATGGAKGARYNNFKSVQSGRNSLLLPYKNLPFLMLLLNLPFLFFGYLTKSLVFHLRGFGAPWRQGAKEGFALLPKIKKPVFRLKNLPHYLWVQGSLFVSTFRFLGWRIGQVGRK